MGPSGGTSQDYQGKSRLSPTVSGDGVCSPMAQGWKAMENRVDCGTQELGAQAEMLLVGLS